MLQTLYEIVKILYAYAEAIPLRYVKTEQNFGT